MEKESSIYLVPRGAIEYGRYHRFSDHSSDFPILSEECLYHEGVKHLSVLMVTDEAADMSAISWLIEPIDVYGDTVGIAMEFNTFLALERVVRVYNKIKAKLSSVIEKNISQLIEKNYAFLKSAIEYHGFFADLEQRYNKVKKPFPIRDANIDEYQQWAYMSVYTVPSILSEEDFMRGYVFEVELLSNNQIQFGFFTRGVMATAEQLHNYDKFIDIVEKVLGIQIPIFKQQIAELYKAYSTWVHGMGGYDQPHEEDYYRIIKLCNPPKVNKERLISDLQPLLFASRNESADIRKERTKHIFLRTLTDVTQRLDQAHRQLNDQLPDVLIKAEREKKDEMLSIADWLKQMPKVPPPIPSSQLVGDDKVSRINLFKQTLAERVSNAVVIAVNMARREEQQLRMARNTLIDNARRAQSLIVSKVAPLVDRIEKRGAAIQDPPVAGKVVELNTLTQMVVKELKQIPDDDESVVPEELKEPALPITNLDNSKRRGFDAKDVIQIMQSYVTNPQGAFMMGPLLRRELEEYKSGLEASHLPKEAEEWQLLDKAYEMLNAARETGSKQMASNKIQRKLMRKKRQERLGIHVRPSTALPKAVEEKLVKKAIELARVAQANIKLVPMGKLVADYVKEVYFLTMSKGESIYEDNEIKVTDRIKGSSTFELITLPAIRASLFIDEPKLAELFIDALMKILAHYQNRYKKRIPFSLLFYAQGFSGPEDTKGIKVMKGNGFDGRIVAKLPLDREQIKRDFLITISNVDQRTNEKKVKGSDDVEILWVNPLGAGHVLHTTKFMLHYIRLPKFEGQIEEELKSVAHFSTLIKPHLKIRSIISNTTVLKLGICLYEAYIIIRDGKHTQMSRNDWENYVCCEFWKENEERKLLAAEGKIFEFAERVFKDQGINIPVYIPPQYKFHLPHPLKPPTNLFFVLYANHAYVGSFAKLISAYDLPLEKNASNKEIMYAVSQLRIKMACKKYKLYTMKYKKAKQRQIDALELECEEDVSEGSVIKHIHWALDYETYTKDEKFGLQEPYLLVVTCLNTKAFYTYYGSDCTTEFLFGLILPLINSKEANEYHHFWAFNGAGFDFHFIVKKLQYLVGIKILGNCNHLKSLHVTDNIDFLDLACWYSVPYDKDSNLKGLAALAKKCKTPHQKTSFDYNVKVDQLGDETFKQKAIEYCQNDVLVLMELVEMLVVSLYETFEYGERVACGNSRRYPHSAASLAIRIFKQCFLEEEVELKASPFPIYELENKSYHGGLTLAMKSFGKDLRFLDINSSYPAVARENMPLNFSFAEHGNFVIYDKDNLEEIIDTNLYEVTEFHFKDDDYLPCFMIKNTKTAALIQVTHYKAKDEKEYIYVWGCELRAALEVGAIVTIGKILHYTKSAVFKEYSEFFYAKKAEAKQKGDSVREIFYKTILNSLYGKLGQKNYQPFSVGVPSILAAEIYEKGYDQIEENVFLADGTYKIKWKEDPEAALCKIGALCRFPSYIDAKARINLITTMRLIGFQYVYYGDTDSIVVWRNAPIPKAILSNTELGLFKIEFEKDSDFIFFFGSKNYSQINGADAHAKCKGLRSIANVKEFIEALRKGETYTSTIFPFFIKRFGRVYVSKTRRTVMDTFDLKRKRIGTDSRPFLDVEEYDKEYAEFYAKKTKFLDTKKEPVTDLVPVDIRKELESDFQTIFEKGEDLGDFYLSEFMKKSGIDQVVKAPLVKELFKNQQLKEAELDELLILSHANEKMNFNEIKDKILDVSKELDKLVKELISSLDPYRLP